MAKYNGWNNYETWVVFLYLDADCYTDIIKDLKEEYPDNTGTRINKLSEILESDVDEMLPKDKSALVTALLSSAITKVDWDKIAENLLEK